MKALLLLLPLVLASCSSLGTRVVPPNVAIVGMQLANIQLVESAVAVTVRIENENPDPIIVTGGVHKIYVDGEFVGKALDNRRVEVPALGSANHTVIANVSNLALATRLGGIINSGSYNYEIKSHVYAALGTSGRRRRFPVQREGKVDLQGLGLGPQQPRYRAPAPVRAQPLPTR